MLLRWNQGQELRQALITIAVSVIIADQVIAHFPRQGVVQVGGGNAVSLTWPGWTERLVDLQVWNVDYSLARLVMLALGVVVGIGLWLWLYRTRTGMVIRAGVDDRQMTSALGINIQKTFAIAFASAPRWRRSAPPSASSQGDVASGTGRAVAAELARRRDRRRDGLAPRRGRRLAALRARVHVLGRLPADHERQLLHAVLDRAHVRPDRARARVPPAGALRESRMRCVARPEDARPSASIGARAARARSSLGPAFFNDYWVSAILTQTLIFGIAAASLIFLSAYGGMISLAQTALMGIAGLSDREHGHPRAGPAARRRA